VRARFSRRGPLRALAFALAGGAAFAWSACVQAPRYPFSGHYDGERFVNPGHETDKSLGDLLRWQWTRTRGPWPEHVENVGRARLLALGDADPIAATWIGHAAALVQIGPANVLTDPVFSERCSPVSWAGPKRVRAPGLSYDELPPIHAVVVSHGHYDHLDLPSLRELHRRFRPLVVVPLGHGDLLRAEGLDRVVELDWWGSVRVPAVGLVIHLAPSLHWSARGLFDRREALWGSFFLQGDSGYSAYFAGDTGYGSHFAEARARFGAPDLALLPIGAYAPRWFMSGHHMDPADAVQAFLDLGARAALPLHYATFPVADDGFDEPLRDLAAAKGARGVGEAFAPVEVGATLRLPPRPSTADPARAPAAPPSP
jgi:L-ascorbate metabolism protein UlaG (beta-lactamase superfamily)